MSSFFSRIVRNKAAEKAKGSVGSHSPPPSSQPSQNTPTGQTGSGMGGGTPNPNLMGLAPGSDISGLNRPSYSINGILGIPQADANANINKRKRGDEGKTKTAK